MQREAGLHLKQVDIRNNLFVYFHINIFDDILVKGSSMFSGLLLLVQTLHLLHVYFLIKSL